MNMNMNTNTNMNTNEHKHEHEYEHEHEHEHEYEYEHEQNLNTNMNEHKHEHKHEHEYEHEHEHATIRTNTRCVSETTGKTQSQWSACFCTYITVSSVEALVTGARVVVACVSAVARDTRIWITPWRVYNQKIDEVKYSH